MRNRPLPYYVLIRSLLLVICIGFFTARSRAADFFVTNGNNAGAGSLRQAILDANANASAPHTITFTVSGIINITSSLPTITRQVTIDGGNSVTISAPGGNNTVALFVLGTGANNTVIRNITLRNTGLEPIRLSVALSGITIYNVTMTQTGAHYMNRAILANAAVSNITIRKVTVTGLEDRMQAIYFGGNVTNAIIDSFYLSTGGGVTARGIHVQGAANGFTLKNSTIDLDDPATADDGDHGIYFAATASNVTIDSSLFRDCEVYSVYCVGNATNFSIKNSTFDNLDGGAAVQFVRIETSASTNGVVIDKNKFNADMRNTTDDGNYGVVLGCVSNQTLSITNNTFNEIDGNAIYIGSNHNNNHDNVTIKGNTFTRNGSGAAAQGGIRFYARNYTSDGGPVLITENTFKNNNGVAIGVYPANTTSYVVPNFTISKNIISGTQSVLGAIQVSYNDKIVITQNSIFNNAGKGIELTEAGNCAYEGVNTPQILSSVETSAGIYTVTIKLPAICGTGNCSIELFSNEAGIKGVGGQHYVTTKTGLSTGNNTLTGITGSFAEITGAPYGTWSATLRVANNCGTSEFSNKKAIKPNGPAGVNTNIALWLRAEDLSVGGNEPTANGQVITGWEEFSGGGGPSATTVVNDPRTKLSGINYNPVADMDNDVIRGLHAGAPSWITSATTTTIAVFNPLSLSASGDRFFCLFAQGASDYNSKLAQIEFYRTGNNINSYRDGTLLNPAIPGTTGVKAFDRPGVFSSLTSASNHTSYYNGANMGSGNYSKGNFAISQWFVGGGWNTTNGWDAIAETDFAEVCTYNRVLNATELQKIQSYFGLKYGIALKQNYILSNGTLVWDVTANAQHSKEIAALAKDKLSVLHQKQARAFQTDEVISISLGSALAATNKENNEEVTNDLSVFMWGNDSAATTYTQAFAAGVKSSLRMPRVWKVKKTNWTDQDITINLTGAKSNIYLIISNDPSFATISQELPFRADGTITISSSLLADGNYFTFGREQKRPGGVLSGLSVWLKADEGVTLSGTNAITWQDQSPAQRVWPKVNTTAVTWNSAAINYNPANVFAGGTYFTYSSFTNSYTQGEVFSVQSSGVNNVASFPWQLGGNSSSTGVVYRYTDNNMYLHFGTNARQQFSYGTKNLALPVILNVNSLSNSWTASLDGKVFSGPAAYTTAFAQASGLIYNYIGAGHNSIFNGQLPEVILYNRKLNSTERQQVNSYLALKYGITMDQTIATDYLASNGTTTMWDASDNSTYNKNIAGIGRDDDGSLNQKQSRSINTASSGNLIAIAVGNELAESNAANTDTITNDKSFFAWADNGGAITYTTNVSAANASLRMPRVWKVDKTNWATRDITMKLFTSVTNTYLLISNTDAAFAVIDQEIAINADSTITISSDLLPDGAYFTFAKEIKGPGFINSGVQLWLRADDITASSSSWNDYSGNDADATQAVVANQPTLVAGAANFNPAFRFNGTSHYMDVAYRSSFNGNVTVYTVHSQTAGSSYRTPIASRSSVSSQYRGWNYYRNVTGREWWTGAGTATWSLQTGGTAPVNTMEIIGLDATLGSGNSSKHIYANGATTATVTNASYASNTVSGVRIGAINETLNYYWNGDITESVIYNRILSADERKHVESYLALKYGITLDQTVATDYVATDWDGVNGTKMWTASKNGAYNKNIAGIGRDDKTALYQKQSRSVSDTLVTVALGNSVAASNALNTTDIDDLSFFAWADNGGATTFSVAVSGVANATSRMARVWKVDRTNWSDQNITFKIPPGGERYLLVHPTDPTFGVGTTEFPVNVISGTVTVNTADLPDGCYFTLATKIVGPACVNNGIAAWFRADYAASETGWVDFSGNQTNATQTTAANQPSLLPSSLNYNPALNFNGSTDYLQIAQADINGKFPFGNSARTIVGVGAATSNATDQAMFTYGSYVANQGSGFRRSVTEEAVFEGHTNTYNVIGPANSWRVNKTTLVSGRYTGGASGVASLFVNGTTSIASAVRNWATTISTNGAQIGKYVGENRYFTGNVGEVIIYNRNLTDDEFLRVSSYLALKYGITLNQSVATDYIASDGTTKVWTAADNTGYNRRITGIGRDDCTNLYQKQSLSIDTGIVAIAIGDAIATSNADNANEIGNDNSYFVIADNGASTSYTSAISGLLDLTTCMPRTWKVDKTNWADADVSFKLTGGNDKIYLVVSSDATFDGSDAAYRLDASGLVTVPSGQIPDGAYFTFAKAVNGPGYVNIGVQFWLRADDNVSTVDTWQDYSGNDNHATQVTAASQPVSIANSVNYNPAFDFDGSNDYMDFATNASITGTNPFTVVSVQMRNTVGTNDGILAQQGTATNGFLNYYTTANKYGVAPTGGTTITSTGTYGTANIPYMNALTRSGNLFSLYTNGNADGSGMQAFSFLTNNLRLGNRDVTADVAFDGHINEVVVYNKTLSTDELRQVNSYLALKYGITMSGNYIATDGTTTYWNATTNTGYLNNIAGIGRDDKTALYQKQSRSINTLSYGNMVAMSLGTIAATNKDNASVFDDDMTFLVWGDNGQTGTKITEYPTSLDPGGCSRITRLQREWKVQKTGTLNDLQLIMYLAGQVPSSTSSSDLKLLIDDDGDFGNGGTTVIEPSGYDVATQTVSFDNVGFSDGQYFTLVTDLTNQAPGGVTANLNVWYRADKGITISTGASLWADQSALPKDVTQATAGSQPTYNTTANLINFNPTLGFDAGDVMSNSAITQSASGGEDIFAVIMPNAVAGTHNVVGLGTLASTTNTTELRLNANRVEYLSNNGASQSIINSAVTNGMVQLANGNRTGAGAANLLINGNSVASGTISQMPAGNYINIGARRASAANSSFFNGQIAEVAVYNRQLNSTEREKAATYFAIKYGITLPHNYIDPNGTIVWNAATNAGFGYNITGIGRDDCNGLHQKQSKNVNSSEALVTLGNGVGIAASNATNTNILNNASALLAGDDNANRTLWSATNAPMNRERIARTWKVQETGTVGTVTLQAPANSSSATAKLPLERELVYLLVSNSTDFTTGATEVEMSLNGTTWETTYDFTSGQYFTFATKDQCAASVPVLTSYNAETTSPSQKCYVDGWILFRDPVDATKYIAAIYDPSGLINLSQISIKIDVNTSYADLGKGDPGQAARLMRRMLEINCNNCFDAANNPNPNFIVRMFYSPTEKQDAENVEPNNMESIKSANGLSDPHFFKWFKASNKTVDEVVSGLSPMGIQAGGQEWFDGALLTGQSGGIDYVDFTNVNGFSTFGGIYAANLFAVLPVKWLDVEATPVNDHTIRVKWSTASEINNESFEVERSEELSNFYTVARVPAKGNTTSISYYAVDDKNVRPGIKYYYRIKQISKDGADSYSKIVSVQSKGESIIVKILPNPVKQDLNLQVTVEKRQQLQIVITDVAGKTLEQNKMNAEAGDNLFKTNMTGYANGTYFIKVIMSDGTVTRKKFVVQK